MCTSLALRSGYFGTFPIDRSAGTSAVTPLESWKSIDSAVVILTRPYGKRTDDVLFDCFIEILLQELHEKDIAD
jgi:hypothetical protein